MSSIFTIFGTRPEIIKLAPVIAACEEAGLQLFNLFTGQHLGLGSQLLKCFDIHIHRQMAVMEPGQSLNALLSRSIAAIDPILARENTDAVVVQGDTTSALAGALSAQLLGIPVIHVEAGLRTGDRSEPFPEEINRRLISRIASLHCAATSGNVHNLIAEGIDRATIIKTGNPIVDAVDHITNHTEPSQDIQELLARSSAKKLIVATMHRRENFGIKLDGYLCALDEFMRRHEDAVLVFPVHPNPNVRDAIERNLSAHGRNILLPSLDYTDFLFLMRHATVIISDSGGIQEEAASIGTPLLVLRSKTERPEAIEIGAAQLIAKPDHLAKYLERFWLPSYPGKPSRCNNPFGDGKSAGRIAQAIVGHLASNER